MRLFATLLTLLATSPARAATEAPLTGTLVCAVRGALGTPWSATNCEDLAAALNETGRPRTLLAIGIIESRLRPHAVSRKIRLPDGRIVRDAGLLGVRCVLSGVRCSNLSIDGNPIRYSDLFRPAVNVAIANRIVEEKVRSCGSRWANCYNGNPSGSNKYSEQISVLTAAFSGAQAPGGAPRIRAMAEKILRFVFRTRRS